MNLRESLLTVALVVTTASAALAADAWKIPYGKEKGQVACYNANTDKKFAEDQPFGPMAMRVVKDRLWLLDSIGGRIYSFSQDNRLASSLEFKGLPGNLVLEDFALVNGSSGEPESVWFAEAAECFVRKVSLASGKELLKIGGNGNAPGKFLQINQLETDRTGRLYVGDVGRGVIAVFTPYGELVREIPWQRSGFALDKSSSLYILHFSDSSGYFLNVYTVKGQLEKSLHIGMPELTNARVWAVTPDGNVIVSFVPATGFKGVLKLFEITPFGKILKRLEIKAPTTMNRYLAGAGQNVWLAEADFFKAPQGAFEVKSIKWGETR
jgi:sugar lactone lactonase YvrE